MKNKKLLILFLFLALVVGTIAFFILNSKPNTLSSSEKEKDLSNMLGRKANLSPKVVTGEGTYSGKTITFSYPKAARIYNYKGNIPAGLSNETFSFDLEDPRIVFNFMEEDGASIKSLDDIPSVKLREDPSRGYTRSEASIDGNPGLSFTRTGSLQEGSEKSGFFFVNGNSYYFSVTGGDTKAVDKLFDQVISSAFFK